MNLAVLVDVGFVIFYCLFFGIFFLYFQFIKFCFYLFYGLIFVFVLGMVVLVLGYDFGWDVGNMYCRFGMVNVLIVCVGCVINVNVQICWVDFDINIIINFWINKCGVE